MLFGPVVLRTKFFVCGFVLCGALMMFSQLSVSAAESVTLTWNPSDDPTIAGYKIYYGVASHNYSDVVTVGKTNSATITGLTVGATYYFAASCFDVAGNESDLSNETSYTVPVAAATLTTAATAGTGQFDFAVSGSSGCLYVIEASTNLMDWVPVQTNTAPFTFRDSNTAACRQRFFRALARSP